MALRLALRPAAFRPLALGAAVVASLGLLAACDSGTDPDGTVTFGGVTYELRGDAEARVEGDRLVVSNIGASGEDGVGVAGAAALSEVDIRLEPVGIPAGGRFGLEVFGADGGAALAVAWADGIADTLHQLNFDYAPALGVSAVRFEYLFDGELIFTSPPVPLGDTFNRLVRTAGSGGGGGPTSVHYVRDGGQVVMVTDYESADPLQGCAGIFLSTPFTELPLCVDNVRVVPLDGQFPDVTGFDVTGRSVGSFAIVRNTVRGR